MWRGSFSRNLTKQRVKSSIVLKPQIGSQLWKSDIEVDFDRA
jgi:hypothetical protein